MGAQLNVISDLRQNISRLTSSISTVILPLPPDGWVRTRCPFYLGLPQMPGAFFLVPEQPAEEPGEQHHCYHPATREVMITKVQDQEVFRKMARAEGANRDESEQCF